MKNTFGATIGAIGLAGLAYWGFFSAGYGPSMPGYHYFFYSPDKYERELTSVVEQREKIREEYRVAFTQADQFAVISRAGVALDSSVVERLFPYWYGTEYSFTGNTDVPGRGTIACGYFVTTVLEDAGVALEREELAQAPSEEMIVGLIGEENTTRYSDTPVHQFLSDVLNRGKGLYLIGLDTHTGFIWHDGETLDFIHASARSPHAVVRERAEDSQTIAESRYRVVGKISDNPGLLASWLGVDPPIRLRMRRLR